jgi:cell division protein FtsQ
MDLQGKLMPWSPNFTPRTLIAAGNINEKYHEWCKTNIDQIINNDTLKTSTLLDDLYALTRFILANKFWQAYTEQIFVNEKGDIELVPKVGNHKIIFGNADEIPEKFWKLKVFYKEGLNYTGWENYDTLNLKFKNQVVCTRKIKEIRN